MQGDEVMLQQVVVNLMRNALDALRSDPPAAPLVALRLLVRAQGVEVQVCDNGCGLDDAAAARLFVPFASTKPDGFGIGSFEARSLISAMGGRLVVDSTPGVGSEFSIFLPAADEAAQPQRKRA